MGSPDRPAVAKADRVWTWVARSVVALAAAAALGVGVVHGTYAASDTDPFGYVSQADLLARGSLSLDNTLARQMPWPHAELSFTPAGYVTRVDHAVVPSYPTGLPLLMAAFQLLGGRDAVYYVVPLLGALVVFMTWRMATRLIGSVPAAVAAVLVASSPILLHQIVAPVGDVPAAAWWVTALALAVGGGPRAALAAGLAASMAILTRPNLVPLAAVIAAYLAWVAVRSPEWRGLRRVVLFVGAVVPGCLAVAWFNHTWYGSPLKSGYGEIGEIYAWANLRPNLDRYPLWLVQAHSPLIALALLAPLLAKWLPARDVRETQEETTGGGHPSRRAQVWLHVGVVATLLLSYLFYSPWDHWGFVRFLLPAIPSLVTLMVAVAWVLLRRVTANSVALALVAVSATAPLVVWQWHQAVRHGTLSQRDVEHRYVDVGRYIDRVLPVNSVFITGVHSGSIRYYSGRPTVRFDVLGPGWVDEAVEALERSGYKTYIVLEDAEEQIFRERFGERTLLGRLDWPPAVQRSDAIQVKIYDPADRPRFMAGEPVTTGDLLPHRALIVSVRPALTSTRPMP